jgi:hypothetical protein
VRLECPELGIDEAATEPLIRTTIPKLLELENDAFAILSIGEGTYLQTLAEDGLFVLEYQLVSTAAHYELPERVTTDVVTNAFLSYAFGMKEWARELPWRKLEL